MAHDAPALDTSTKLAYDGTLLAYERTLLAWVRTAASLITFGFSIYKFFQLEVAKPRRSPFGAREFGILMVTVGLATLALAAVGYWQQRKRVIAAGDHDMPRLSVLALVALIAFLGIFALVAIAFW